MISPTVISADSIRSKLKGASVAMILKRPVPSREDELFSLHEKRDSPRMKPMNRRKSIKDLQN
jgi:hypothetical protein